MKLSSTLHLILVCFSIVILTSCNSDDDTPVAPAFTSSGTFNIDDVSFPLDKGFTEALFLDNDDNYLFRMLLAGPGISFDQVYRGKADAVQIDLYVSNFNSDFVGTYSITDLDSSITAGKAVVNYLVDIDLDNDTVMDEEEIESGTLTVTKNPNNSYTFTLNDGVVDITMQDFKIDYTGKIEMIF